MFKTILGILLFLCSSVYTVDIITGRDTAYLNICSKAAEDPHYFKNFRSMPEYFHALEISNGSVFADYLLSHASDEIINKLFFFGNLERYGNPKTTFYPKLGNFSATTLRYITIADEISKLFRLPENPKLVEVGAGFGGQCYVLSQLYQWSKYYIYDLPEPSALIKKCCAL